MTTDAVGGVWVYSSKLAQILAKRGWKVSLVTLGPAARKDQLRPLFDNPSIKVKTSDLALEWRDPEGNDEQRSLDYLGALGRKLKPDIVHLNGYREALADWQAPVLVAAHSCVRSWWQDCRGCEPDDRRWVRYGARVAAGLDAANCWIAPSAAFRDKIEGLYAPRQRGQVIWNGIGRVSGKRKKEPFILAAGRLWDEAKNIGMLTSIAGRLDWPLRIAGALNQEGADGCNLLDATAEWLGDLAHDDLLTVMSHAGIFASSACYEPFGLTILEAAASGAALVLADVPTLKELWAGAALFADPRDGTAFKEILNYVSRNANVRASLQNAARLRSTRYSLSIQADAYEALYTDMIWAQPGRSVRSPFIGEAAA
jgi:glycosyltransferase involved in cell wall biosynthesis